MPVAIKFYSMKITVNGKEISSQANTLSSLKDELGIAGSGTAIAVNGTMVRKTDWDSFIIKENDNILIIRAACGG